MPHSKTALILIVAFALPSAADALGLGEIHVNSALDEPLAAEVDIVGATAEDLAGISASVANSDTFLRFGVARPAFLSTASFRIATDRRGQPVLAIRSTDAFTEPLINVLIDLHWRSGELIRQYTLLLDPPGFPSDSRSPGPPQPRSPAVGEPVPPETVKVAAGATLRGIASRVNSRGNAGLERTMIAIFRANPKAFEGNINRLRRGAVLAIPASPEVSKISSAEANHEVRLQMDAWRASPKFVGSAKPQAPAVAAPAPAPFKSEIPADPLARQESVSKTAPYGVIHASGSTAEASDDASLDRRVQLLEKGLNELQGTLGREQQTLAGIQARVALADQAPAVTAVPTPSKPGHSIAATLAAVLVLASGALVVLYAWRRHRMLYLAVSPAAAKTRHADAPQVAVPAAATLEPTPAVPARNELPFKARIEEPSENEVRLPVVDASAVECTLSGAAILDSADSADSADLADTADTANLAKVRAADANAETTPLKAVRAIQMPEVSAPENPARDNAPNTDKSDTDTAKLQYKLLDLDGTVHHVSMPSILYEKGQFKERRTSLVDVLKVAVKREPNRRDLRMKLLETYYAAAATGRQGFLEIAQSLAGERANMAETEWGKIAGMGRLIAADHDLFTPHTGQADGNDLATCA